MRWTCILEVATSVHLGALMCEYLRASEQHNRCARIPASNRDLQGVLTAFCTNLSSLYLALQAGCIFWDMYVYFTAGIQTLQPLNQATRAVYVFETP